MFIYSSAVYYDRKPNRFKKKEKPNWNTRVMGFISHDNLRQDTYFSVTKSSINTECYKVIYSKDGFCNQWLYKSMFLMIGWKKWGGLSNFFCQAFYYFVLEKVKDELFLDIFAKFQYFRTEIISKFSRLTLNYFVSHFAKWLCLVSIHIWICICLFLADSHSFGVDTEG